VSIIDTPATTLPDEVEVVIVGSGFAGLGMAIRLAQEGLRDFVVLEQAGSVGGTWRDNVYPGCACDVPSHLYSFSFAQNPDWTRTFSPQPEIRAYLERTTDRFGVRPHIRLNARMTRAEWDDDAQLWQVEVNGEETITARVLVPALGPLNRPAYPDVPGIEDFQGKAFHSMEWDTGHDFAGERVAVIGTGASAIQFVPRLAREAARVELFQRTPPWVLPRPDRRVPRWARWVFRHVPGALNAYRQSIYWRLEARVVGFEHPRVFRFAEALGKRHIRRQVRDPHLRRKLVPDYRIGCKRILMSNDYYPALDQPHVDVHTERLERFTARGVVTADGVEHPVDTIVLGTGFRITDLYTPLSIIGRDGVDVNDAWAAGGGIQAYKGSTVAGFPNMFLLVGPNTGLGHNSIVYMIEAQVEYVLDALRTMRQRRLGAVTVRREAQTAFNAGLQHRLAGTVWSEGGCRSWYVDPDGTNRTLWPGHTYAFREATREFDAANYELAPAAAPTPAPQAA
jgi:cation diffusion facilitator CzcD-associated flavoprotein CzcO